MESRTCRHGRGNHRIGRLLAVGLGAILAASAGELDPDLAGFRSTIQPFLTKYCISCHGADHPKAGLRLDQVNGNLQAEAKVAAGWGDTLDRMNLGEMPPAKAAEQPSQAERAAVVGWISRELSKAAQRSRSTGGQVVMRRLTRSEYQRSMADLLGVEPDIDGLPQETKIEGFDNVGSALVTAPIHIEQFVELATAAVDAAIDERAERPDTELWRLELQALPAALPAGAIQVNQRAPSHGSTFTLVSGGIPTKRIEERHPPIIDPATKKSTANFQAFMPGRPSEYDGAWGLVPTRMESGVIDLGFNQFLIRETGRYRIRVRAKCSVDPLRWPFGLPNLSIRPPTGAKPFLLQPFERPEQTEVFTAELDLRAGRRFGIKVLTGTVDDEVLKRFKGQPLVVPRAWCDWIEFEGPCFPVAGWPMPVQQRILAGWDPWQAADNESKVRIAVERFLAAAFRRPVRNDEVDRRMTAWRAGRAAGATALQSFKSVLVGILVSPHFLYQAEPQPTGHRRLNGSELAVRLAYFLWGRPPDDELRRLADAGELAKPAVLAGQTGRLLRDGRSRAMLERFMAQWLDLDHLANFSPDSAIYPDWDEELRSALRQEPIAFATEILARGLSLVTFLRADFVTVNERLATYYGIAGVIGDQFRAVKQDANTKRSGLLTQGAILCLGSNGTRTSPVKRGVYVLERILGDPPPPPPPGAGEIANAVPGEDKITVRERLKLHRAVPACASCHEKIDPLGFAFERYDGIGRLRTAECSGDLRAPKTVGAAVDASGTLPNGKPFSDFAGLQEFLVDEKHRFLRCLTKKMLIFALGRELEFTDRDLIEALTTSLVAGRDRFPDLIAGIVASEQFQSK
ncbi:hypothetical protein LBMAG53_19210 [Planctomycetota bacterium]|nr:hypothetical protein LBMAG53_19210 [Planctomycetota bacterium]